MDAQVGFAGLGGMLAQGNGDFPVGFSRRVGDGQDDCVARLSLGDGM